MPAYFRATLGEWITASDHSILGIIEEKASRQGFAVNFATQTQAWITQIQLLKTAAASWLRMHPSRASWSLLMEYPIPRRHRRIDSVLLASGAIFCIEFKIESTQNSRSTGTDRGGVRQVEDYALDLRDFHSASQHAPIFPILAQESAGEVDTFSMLKRPAHVAPVVKLNGGSLADYVEHVVSMLGSTESDIDPYLWDNASYHPVPTIIEAAELIFAQNDVREIAHSAAGTENLAATADCLLNIVNRAKSNREKIVCFITGVPGAGKTLAGLNLAHSPELRAAGLPPSVFLTGNGPLVRVVSEALASDKKISNGLSESRRTVSTFIQNVHTYIREGLRSSKHQPESIVVFDEAQRAWNAAHVSKKFKQLRERGFDVLDQQFDTVSEPAMMLKVMDRQPEWAVLVTLVGGGQEINDGEAGLSEWGHALENSFPHWKVAASPVILPGGSGIAGHRLFSDGIPSNLEVTAEAPLHLDVCVRSLRADSLSSWVDAVIEGNATRAKEVIPSLDDYPIVMTRNLAKARLWLNENCRGERRSGLLASSGALRLRADGIEVSPGFRGANKKQYENWFLKPTGDIRSSSQLEIAASQFECQGLEIDWSGLCWGEDLLWQQNAGWIFGRLNGATRARIPRPEKQRFVLNGYRVLLTRARAGMVIYVPRTATDDETRPSELFDSTFGFLAACGVSSLDTAVASQ